MRSQSNYLKLKVEKLPDDDVSPADLRKLFSRFGEVDQVRVHWCSGRVFALIALWESEDKQGDWLDPLHWRGCRLAVDEGWYL